MKKVKCHIVEDEPLAAELLEDYIAKIPFLELTGVSVTAIEASLVLKKMDIQLLFLDLHLPGIKGFDFIKGLYNPPRVIVTSAYPQYALEGYDLNVVDYLVKPIEFGRFFRAVNKLQDSSSWAVQKPVVYFQENRKKVPVDEDAIYFIEAQGNYVKIHLKERTISSKCSLKETLSKISSTKFLRIHKSFVVSCSKIESFNKNKIIVLGRELPVGRIYKKTVDLAINNLR
nr:LytTR family DNA-binding domain-containing protein [Allomuricauda sp.]